MAYQFTLEQASSALAITFFSLAATHPGAALAQTPAPATGGTVELEEIIVTGSRAYLRSALVEKRNATEQVDAINAGDIADFPDNNLAESLQRLPGVFIDRDNNAAQNYSSSGRIFRIGTRFRL